MSAKIKNRHERQLTQRKQRPIRQRFLIVCEGKQTEPNYFKALTKGIGSIHCEIRGKGKNTKSLVKEAITLKANNDFDKIWVVFDKDAFTNDDFNGAIAEAERNDIECAWSNEAFELWYLFHFQENSGGAISRDRYKEMLSNHLTFKYEKNNPEMFEILLPQLQLAIERSARALARWSDGTPFHNRNPATTVHELVGELIRYI